MLKDLSLFVARQTMSRVSRIESPFYGQVEVFSGIKKIENTYFLRFSSCSTGIINQIAMRLTLSK